MRTKSLPSLFTLGLLLPLAVGCGGDAETAMPAEERAEAPAAAAAAMPPQVTARIDGYVAAWNGDDPAAVAAFFMADATARVNDDTHAGRQAILREWLPLVPRVDDLRLREIRTEQRGQDHYAEGTYTHAPLRLEDGLTVTSGRYAVTWTQDADGQWRIRASELIRDEPQP